MASIDNIEEKLSKLDNNIDNIETLRELRKHSFYKNYSIELDKTSLLLNSKYIDLFRHTPSMSVDDICSFRIVDKCPLTEGIIYYDRCKLLLCGDDGNAIEISINENADCYNYKFLMLYINWILPQNKQLYDSDKLFELIKKFQIPMISLLMQERILRDYEVLDEAQDKILTLVENCLKTSADGFGEFSLWGIVTSEQMAKLYE
jgi:hypothetical protein